MTREELMEIKSVIGDMRFMQASALVASKLESKESRAYMNNLARLEKVLGNELITIMGLNNE